MRELIIEMANNNIGSLCLFLKNKKNIKYLSYLELNIPKMVIDRSLSEKVYYFVNNIEKLILCDCGDHKSFIGFKSGYRSTCGSKKCYVNIRKKTCLEKYGVDNPKKSKEILKKEKENINKKWGGIHYMYNKNIRKKFNMTMIKNWGVEWAQQSKKISNKSRKTFENNPNRVEIINLRTNKIINKSIEEKQSILNKRNITISKNWKNSNNLYKYISLKIREKSILNFGVNHHLSHPDIIKKRINSYYNTITNKIKISLPNNIIYIDRTNNINNSDSIIRLKCLDCNSEFNINRQYLVNRINMGDKICLYCNPIFSGKSNMEIELLHFIENNYSGKILSNVKSIINGELDIFIPELKLAFEFNGLYWHSEQYKGSKYHLNKTKECLCNNIQLMHIWEDDWLYKQDIVKSIILNKLGRSEKIFARKCQIKTPNSKECREFLSKNHIQGFIGSKVKIGLYYNNELVSLMTFGNLRKSLGQISKDGSWELLRFCSKLNTTIIGGASKLFKYFLDNYKVNDIISYSDNSRSNGDLYQKLGFKFIHESDPNYYYIINNTRNHRFNFRKDKLIREGYDPNKTEIQIMNDRGIQRIFDCGSKRWVFTK